MSSPSLSQLTTDMSGALNRHPISRCFVLVYLRYFSDEIRVVDKAIVGVDYAKNPHCNQNMVGGMTTWWAA